MGKYRWINLEQWVPSQTNCGGLVRETDLKNMAWTFIHGYNARFFHGGRARFGILYERNPYFLCIYLEYQNTKIYHHANIGRIAHEPMAALQGTVGSVSEES